MLTAGLGTEGSDLLNSVGAEAISGLLEGIEPSVLNGRMLAGLAQALEADRASLARIDGDQVVIQGLSRSAVPGGSEVAPFKRSQRSAPLRTVLAHPLFSLAVERRTVVSGRGLAFDRGLGQSAAIVVDLRHLAIAPFFFDQTLLGAFTLSRGRDQPFHDGELAEVQKVANVAALILHSLHVRRQSDLAREQARSTADRLRLALDAARDVAGVESVDEVTRRVLSRAAHATGATGGVISRVEDGHLVAEYELESPGDISRIGASVPIEAVPGAARAAEERATVIAFRASQPRSRGRHETTSHTMAYGVHCPLIAGGELVGMLELSRHDRAFGPDDVAVLDHFASVAALLVRSARLLEAARQGAEAKSRFLNLAAHELRTPLSVIRGYLSMMEDGTFPIPAATLPALEVLRLKSDELTSLVESLLVAARLQAGAVQFEPVRADLVEMARAAAARLRPRLHLTGGHLETSVPEAPVWVDLDPDSIGRVLDNLLNNAVAYSPNGAEIMLSVNSGTEAEVMVEDHGIGIPDGELERVFERFYRGEGAYATVGAGLGLAVSRELAAASGGSLTLVRTCPGEGSVFRLSLPLAPSGRGGR